MIFVCTKFEEMATFVSTLGGRVAPVICVGNFQQKLFYYFYLLLANY